MHIILREKKNLYKKEITPIYNKISIYSYCRDRKKTLYKKSHISGR